MDDQGFVRLDVRCNALPGGKGDSQSGRDGQKQRASRFILQDNHGKSDPKIEMIIIFSFDFPGLIYPPSSAAVLRVWSFTLRHGQIAHD